MIDRIADVLRRWQTVIDAVKIDGPLPIQFEILREANKDAVVLRTAMASLDCVSKAPTIVRRRQDVTDFLRCSKFAADPGTIIDYLHREAEALYRHELDEWFTVKGIRVFDPHKGEK